MPIQRMVGFVFHVNYIPPKKKHIRKKKRNRGCKYLDSKKSCKNASSDFYLRQCNGLTRCPLRIFKSSSASSKKLPPEQLPIYPEATACAAIKAHQQNSVIPKEIPDDHQKKVEKMNQEENQKSESVIENACQVSPSMDKDTGILDYHTPKRIRVERHVSTETGVTVLTKVNRNPTGTVLAKANTKQSRNGLSKVYPNPTSPQLLIYYVRKMKKGLWFGCCIDKVKNSRMIVVETGKHIILTRIKGYVFSDLEAAINGIPIGDLSIVCEDNVVVKLTAKKAILDNISIQMGCNLQLTEISKITK